MEPKKNAFAGPRSKLHDSKKHDEKGRRSPYNPAHSLRGKRHPGDPDDIPSKHAEMTSSRTNTPAKELLQQGITEEAVRRYLTLKPITTKDLLKKFKSRKTGLSNEKTVEKMATILKKLNPQQSKINGIMHLFLKATSTPTTESGIVLLSCCLLSVNVIIESYCSQFS